MKLTVVIRIILSASLLYFSYFETGIFTTIIFGLLLINGEVTGLIFNLQRKNDELDKVLDKMKSERQSKVS